jgi:hypothetical protein
MYQCTNNWLQMMTYCYCDDSLSTAEGFASEYHSAWSNDQLLIVCSSSAKAGINLLCIGQNFQVVIRNNVVVLIDVEGLFRFITIKDFIHLGSHCIIRMCNLCMFELFFELEEHLATLGMKTLNLLMQLDGQDCCMSSC